MIEQEANSPTYPHQYSRRILLVVTGLSPQVVTETLYALAVHTRPAFVPTEIHLLATREGAERARISLLHTQVGWFHRFCHDYKLRSIRFTEENIHVLTHEDGSPLEDLRTPEDNERLADALVDLVREFTADATSAVHVSIAGGRKTMGFYAGYTLSLFGRPQDRLSHVLVSPPYEFNPEFFYPTPDSRIIYTQDRRPLDAKAAEVILAEIPFVRLRHHLPPELGRQKMRFSDAVSGLSKSLAPPELVLDLRQCRVRLNGVEAQLQPQQMALLAWLADRCRRGLPRLICPDGFDREFSREFFRHYRRIVGPMRDTARTQERFREGMDKGFFMQTKSKLLRRLSESGVPHTDKLFCPTGPGRGDGYALNLPPNAIHYAELDSDANASAPRPVARKAAATANTPAES